MSPQQQLSSSKFEVVVVGAGLGGLAAALSLARRGHRVCVCERAQVAGGRGRTRRREGFALNLGAHALYRRGPAMALLRELGIEPRGARPSGRGLLIRGGQAHTLPASPRTTVTTGALDLRAKLGLMRLFARLPRLELDALRELSCREWMERALVGEDLRAFVGVSLRLASYCGELDQLSADAGLAQLRAALGGVSYLHGGWVQVVDALVRGCADAGVELRLGAAVEAVARGDRSRWVVALAEEALACEHVVVAGSPALADALLGPALGAPGRSPFAAAARPCTVASLDLGLRVPWSGPDFVLSADEPIYMSVHSAVAELAPPGHSLVSLIWYRDQDEARAPAQLRARLEGFARRFMPALDQARVVDQFLPKITVAHDIPRPGAGLRARQPPRLRPGLHLVGDWVGSRALLLDGSLASAAAVCEQISSASGPAHAA